MGGAVATPIRGEGDALTIRLAGDWSLRGPVPALADVERALRGPPPARRVVLDGQGLGPWDSSLVTYLVSLAATCRRDDIGFDPGSLPAGLQRLLLMARGAKAPLPVSAPPRPNGSVAAVVGSWGAATAARSADMIGFVGETALAVRDLVAGRAHYRRVDLALALEQVGGSALPLVAVINFLVGAVLAFLGAVQLERFGAAIYVASLVAVGTARETGALMTGIVMAGRTSASFAAVLGTMKVNSEVDALETMNFPPVQYLVAPRVVAMLLMMPLLVVYADVFGIMGGFVVAVTSLDITPALYLHETQRSLAVHDAVVGVLKGLAFGAVVALCGCYFGMRTGRTAASVGASTTAAVVAGILLVIVVDAGLTFFFYAVRM